MTVYEMIQELSEFPADTEIHFCIEGQEFFEEVESGKSVCCDVDKESTNISGSYERGGKCFFDITI